MSVHVTTIDRMIGSKILGRRILGGRILVPAAEVRRIARQDHPLGERTPEGRKPTPLRDFKG